MAVSGAVQCRSRILDQQSGMAEMLARRFTILCLLITLFGMGLAALVADAGRESRNWSNGTVVSCRVQGGLPCLPSRFR